MENVLAVQERQAAHDVFEQRDNVLKPEQVYRSFPVLLSSVPRALASAPLRRLLSTPSPRFDKVREAAAVRVAHENVQGWDLWREAGRHGARSLEPGVVVRDDVGVRDGLEKVDFAQDREEVGGRVADRDWKWSSAYRHMIDFVANALFLHAYRPRASPFKTCRTR